MKSWRKLRELAGFRDKGIPPLEPTQDIEEITKGMQDVQQIKSQYEGLHAVSSRVAARAHGFSEAIHELASYLVNSFGLAGDFGEIHQVFKEVGREQDELSKLLHLYAFHVSGTLTLPTESLLNELCHIEETKKHYDEKRAMFDHMRFRKAKVKAGKLEAQVEQQLQDSKEQFDEIAMFLGCRLHSLEQSRPRNLITQAVRHHAAQMHLFRQSLGFLEEIDPYISRLVHERNLDQSLDYLDGDNLDPKTREDSDQSSSVDQETSPPRHQEHQEPSGIRSAPISPLRFSETSTSSGVNSIHEVMLDGKPSMFNRSNSWLRRKGSRDPGVLHVYKPQPQGAPPRSHSPRRVPAYSVTEPSASPAPRSLSPELSAIQLQKRMMYQRQQEVQQQMKKSLGSFPSFPRQRIAVPRSGPLQPASTSCCQILPVDPLYKSGPLNPSPKVSPAASPAPAAAAGLASSPPRVSELHKLPPPPLMSCSGGSKVIPHSAPLAVRVNVASASPLPPPPLVNSSSKGMKVASKKEERVTPLPPSLNSGHS